MNTLKNYYEKYPLTIIILVAFIIRMFSVLFAKGYGMHDDHFLIIETSRSWASGWDFQGWLQTIPQGHSFTYPLLLFFLFKGLMFVGIENLDIQMYFIRFVHALFSLLTIYFSYKIVFRSTNEKKLANISAWILCLLWCLPWLSVRNLVEITCIPFLLWATWLYIRNSSPLTKDIIYSGAVMGLAFAFRFQVVFFIGGFGLAMLIYKQWKNAIIWTISLLIVFCLTQLSDIFIWHRPFAEMQEYILYNFTNAGDYPQGGFFKYFGVLLGMLVPPISVLLMFGFFYGYKRLFLFLPSFCFFLFHSIFPNKQERFIFPIIPFVIFLGIIGLWDLANKQPLLYKYKRIIKVCIIISIILNTILLVPVTVHYSKKARVESMVHFSKYDLDNFTYIVENSEGKDRIMMPRTYANAYCTQYNLNDWDTFSKDFDTLSTPAFVLFFDDKNTSHRISKLKAYYPNLQYDTTIKPSFLDNLMRKINNHNKNFPYIAYKNFNHR